MQSYFLGWPNKNTEIDKVMIYNIRYAKENKEFGMYNKMGNHNSSEVAPKLGTSPIDCESKRSEIQ